MTTSTIRGRVTDAAGAPVAGAVVDGGQCRHRPDRRARRPAPTALRAHRPSSRPPMTIRTTRGGAAVERPASSVGDRRERDARPRRRRAGRCRRRAAAAGSASGDDRRHRPPPGRNQDQRSRHQRQPGADRIAAAEQPQLPQLRQARAGHHATDDSADRQGGRRRAHSTRRPAGQRLHRRRQPEEPDPRRAASSARTISRGNPFSQIAVQEFRVLTSNFKAEYERRGGRDHRRDQVGHQRIPRRGRSASIPATTD